MKLLFSFSVTVSLLLAVTVTPAIADDFYDVTVVKVKDAKTLIVDIRNLPPVFGSRISVEISGIMVPKSDGQCVLEARLAYEAKRFINYFIQGGSRINLYNMTRADKSFSLGGRIEVDGEDLGQFLINEGIALPTHSAVNPFVWCEKPEEEV